MAIKKYRLQKGTDAIHLETSASLVLCADSTTVESALAGKAASTHSHSGYVPTTRKVAGKALSSDVSISPSDIGAAASTHSHSGYAASSHTHDGYVPTTRKIAGKALSADISLDDLKSLIGVGSPTVTAPTYPSSVPAVGNTLSWAGKTWRVVHKLTGVAILALEYWEKDIVWSSVPSPYYIQEYIGSKIYDECMTFSNTLKLFAADYIIPFGGLPCFIPSYDQVNGDFTYWATQANRIYKNSGGTAKTFWTSTVFAHSSSVNGRAWCVNTDGTLNSHYSYSYVNYSYGFRPCVALRL